MHAELAHVAQLSLVKRTSVCIYRSWSKMPSQHFQLISVKRPARLDLVFACPEMTNFCRQMTNTTMWRPRALLWRLSLNCHRVTRWGGDPVFVTEKEAAAIYAKASWKWYGPKAKSVARSMIRRFGKKGDETGVKAWQRVLEEIEQIEKRSASD